MTSDRRFEHDLPDLLGDLYLGPTPDYRDDILRLVARTPQRPAWAFPERWLPMSAVTLARQALQPLPWRSIGLLAMISLLLVAVLALYAGSQERRLPAPFGPAANGSLVVDEGGDIFLIDPDTGTKAIVFGGLESDTAPIFSRDGTQMAFIRESDGVRSLWIADDRGGGARALSTDGLVDFSQIEWAPDGKSILLSTGADSNGAPAIVPTDGRAAYLIETGMSSENPLWLPGSGEILFRGQKPSGFGVFAIRPDGTGIRAIVPATGAPEWDALFFAPSPDGSQIAYQWRDGDGFQKIYVIPATGGTPRAITSVESVGAYWSPDGTWIAFLGEDGTYVVRADGTAPERRLATTARAGAGSLRWAPDGSRLVVATGQQQLWFDPVGGAGEVAPWTTVELPDWQRLASNP